VVWHELVLELADESAQLIELKEPPALPALHVTVPEGDVGVELASFTVATNVIWFPVVTDAGFGETDVEVGWGGGGLTVSDDEPELVVCVESPA
jgi:hypothetical protein